MVSRGNVLSKDIVGSYSWSKRRLGVAMSERAAILERHLRSNRRVNECLKKISSWPACHFSISRILCYHVHCRNAPEICNTA